MAQKRRGRGEGSIRYRAREGRWEASIAVGDGTRKSHYAKTQREALRWLADARRAIEQGAVLPDERQTVAAYLATWLATVRHDLKAGTVQRHAEIVRLHLVPRLGRLKLAKLTPLAVQSMYSDLLALGLAPATVERIHAVLHKALEDAVRLDVLPRNVCDRVRVPRKRSPAKRVFTSEQARHFLAAAQEDRLGTLYVLALTSGLRLGELLGLGWRNVDLTNGRVEVRRNLQRDRKTCALYLETPKTDAGKREVMLAPQAVEALRRQRAWQREARLRAGAAWGQGRHADSDFVFTNEIGLPLQPTTVYRRFLRICQAADLPRIAFHDLRHTCATLLREAGVNVEVVSAILGHSDIRVTLAVYSHIQPGMLEDAAATMAKVLAS
jgi:integrase